MPQYLKEERKGRVCTLYLNRPERKNALNPEMLEEIHTAFTRLADDSGVRCVIVRGIGRDAFCSGYDLQRLPVRDGGETAPVLENDNPLEKALSGIRAYPYPVIAMLSGLSFGAGCELAVACDMRIGTQNLKAGMPPVRFGIVYSWRGLKRFVDVIGMPAVKEMFFTGATYDGVRLREMGFLDYVVADDEVKTFTGNLAATISANAPMALRGTKHILSLLQDRGNLAAAESRTADGWTADSLNSRDLVEGQRAFLEKRPAEFQDR